MKKPIPWEFIDGDVAQFWIWTTPDFEVRIFAEGKLGGRVSFGWKITDKSQGRNIPFDSSMSPSFQEAVDTVLEIIGKSYPVKLGYRAYAGELATTFEISNGRKIDFAPLIGENVVIRILEEDGSEKILVGGLDVDKYSIQIRTDDSTATRFPPARIKDIQKQFGGASLINNPDSGRGTSTKLKRIFHSEFVRGCTGRPGFKAGTVMHSPGDIYCPIHNV
jgi:hypothetical protein